MQLLRGVKVFLDTDDLDQLSELETYVESSRLVLFFLSSRFFDSANCLREVRSVLDRHAEFVHVRETAAIHGALPLNLHKERCAQPKPP